MDTSIRVKKETKDALKELAEKDESYDNVINTLLMVYASVPEDIIKPISNCTPEQKASIYLGIITDIAFENYVHTKYYEKYLKKLDADKFKAYYPKLVDECFRKGVCENLIVLMSNELVKFEDFTLSSDDIKLYFTYGITWSSYFR